MIHNHPHNTPLSFYDLQTFINTESIKLIIAVGNNGIINYAIKTSLEYNLYNKLSRYIIKQLTCRTEHNIKVILRDEIIKNQKSYGIKIGRINRRRI